ncbi:hypothetical protein FOA52_008885 [Chlamydomonas sp. UWO 241]|nr:hypothetical protein FOA52_008885 [Chlamydomonas sp. UWO 241]
MVRGLTSTGFKSDEALFSEMACASLALCGAYVALYRSAQQAAVQPAQQPEGAELRRTPAGSVRDLSAARLHLRGVLKQCEARFDEHPLFLEMKSLLEAVEGLLAEAAPPKARDD